MSAAAALGMAWGAVVAVGFTSTRPRATRLRSLRADDAAPRRTDVTRVVGRLVLRAARQESPEPAKAQLFGRAALGSLAMVAVIPLPAGAAAAIVVAASVWWLPVLERRREARRRVAQLEAELPEVLDLLVLAVGAGLTVSLALEAVARRGAGQLSRELGHVIAASHQGHRLADALDALPARTGDAVRPLVAALVASERYGAPLAASLDRLAGEVRATRRRRAGEAAQRVSVKLLFPLVLCILPAFALLTVAPLIASALKSLRL